VAINCNEPLVLTPNEARKLIRCSRGKIYSLIKEERIPHIHLGRKIIIPRESFLRWVDSGGGNGVIPK